MDVFKYKQTAIAGHNSQPSELIQVDVEDNLPLFLGKRPEQITNIVIVGAWQGDEVRSFLLLPSAKIFCFEPNPQTFNILQNLYSEHKNVKCFQAACSSSNGKAKFFETNMAGNGSLLEIDKHTTAIPTESLEVTTVRLDTLPELSGQHIDLLWADVQGFELEVLKGAENILANIEALFLEVSVTGSSYKNAVKLEVLRAFLQKYGFGLAALGLDDPGQDGNALFLRGSLDQKALIDGPDMALRLENAIKRRDKKRKLYSSKLFMTLHRLTPQKVRTFVKKRLKKI